MGSLMDGNRVLQSSTCRSVRRVVLQESVATRACAAVDARRARDWHGSLRDEVCILCGITARRHSTPCIPRGFDPQLPQPAILRVIGQETSSCRTCLVKSGVRQQETRFIKRTNRHSWLWILPPPLAWFNESAARQPPFLKSQDMRSYPTITTMQ